jgi:hypothetical protein
MVETYMGRWIRWLHGSIRPHIYTVHLHRHIYQEMAKITQSADLPASYYFDFTSQTYSTTQAIAIRRLADPSRRVVSLGRLIGEIAARPEMFTLDWYVGQFDPALRTLGERGFSANFAGAVGDHLDPAIPRGDLDGLKSGAYRVRRYVDQYVAHLDESPQTADILTYADINEAIDLLGTLYHRYNLLLTASEDISLVPELQHDWKAVFRVPWIEPRAPHGDARS